jgi:hypothetical protein
MALMPQTRFPLATSQQLTIVTSLGLAVVAVGARAATVAVVDPAGRRHLQLQDTAEMSEQAQQPTPEALGPEVDRSSSENVTTIVNRHG